MQKILYQDDTVRIDREQITVIQYFFPIPMDKIIKMKDVECVGLKFDIDKNQKYIEIIVKGFGSLNATFSPDDPNKVMALIQTYSSLARSNLDLKIKEEKLIEEHKKEIPPELKKDIPELKKEDIRNVEPTAEDARKQNQEYQNPSVLSAVTHSISHGWDVMKQGAHDLHEATAEKIHQVYSSHQVDKKAEEAKENVKQGAQTIKQGAEQTKMKAEQKIQQGKQQAKETDENAKEKVSEGWQNVKEGTKNVYENVKDKASQLVGEDAAKKAQSAKENFQQGAYNAADSFKKATGQGSYNLQQPKYNYGEGNQNLYKGAYIPSENLSKKFGDLSLEDKTKPHTYYLSSQALKQKKTNIQP